MQRDTHDTQETQQNEREDGLTCFREEFYQIPGKIYLDGNSLGLLSVRAEKSLLRCLEAWKSLGIDGWMRASPAWIDLAEEIARLTASLIGAHPEEVVVANSTTVNLHQLLATVYEPDATRPRIVTDALAFPSDRYALESHLRLRGRDPGVDLITVPPRDGRILDEEDILAALSDDVQLLIVPSVVYTSGQLLDLPRLTHEAHRRGVRIGVDCAHSIGCVPHRLSLWGVDFAFWCGYKYLNGGPGASGGLYLNRRYHDRSPGLAGWFGSCRDKQFDMLPHMDPAPGAARLQIGTPNILSMAPLLGALEMIAEAGIERIRARSLALTDYLMQLASAELTSFGFQCVTPRAPERRGGHIALAHPEAVRICRALRAHGVVPDYRPPDIVRLAPVALYNTRQECQEAIRRLRHIMETEEYRRYATEREYIV
ncbi:MAG: kynureninase [Chloroherpetonaceae bacterium]|nr:kynureninase [Chthonomonadaceae bacterium]MDW8208724.1 kynureninase [Chloroherpetonaceae bacterium]